MKKIIIALASIVTLLLLTAIILPYVFKDDIQQQIRSTLSESLDARVYFEPSNFGLTLFKSFPNITASIEDFGITGKDHFEGDTLISIGDFNITIDLFSLFGDQNSVKSINLVKPKFNIIVLKDGSANYEIIKESDSSGNTEEPASDFNLSIESWNITDGSISYKDNSANTSMVLMGLNHNGKGNISSDIYDLITVTTIKKTMISYDGINYLSGQELFADLTLNINVPENKFTFKDNEIKVNDFPLSFNGYFSLPAENIEMDISFTSENSSIKSLYSLILGTYTEDYEDIKAVGEMSFSGYVKGIYNEKSIPAFNIKLKVSDGMITYPDLPTPISSIDIDMLVDCKDGIIENTLIDIKKMHMDMGGNPMDGSLIIRNLKDYSMKADFTARIKLAELSSMFPMDGLDMKGLLEMNLKADGIYDSIHNVIPSILANISLENGYIKSPEFPKAVENMSFRSVIECASGNMEDVIIELKDFTMAMEEEELTANLILKNMVDYQWDLDAKGGIDLEVISEVYPVEGIKFSGNLIADFETQGRYSDVEAGRYDRFPTRGTLELTDFDFVSDDISQKVKILNSKITMDPRQLHVESFTGSIGRSDLKLNGFITNYIDYIFKEKELLRGKMNLTSDVLDVNEWMTDESSSEENATAEDETEMEVIIIPANIDFEFNSSIKNIYYDNLNLQNAQGLLTLRDGILDMSNLSFNLLGGSIVMNGKYDTRQPENPVFDYNLKIKSLSIPQAFTSFETIQTFAPMARHMSGDFSTNFNITGSLKNDLSPVYESLNGKGLIQIGNASLKDSKLVTGISKFVKTDDNSNQLTIKDVIMKASLEKGRAYVAPFDVKLAGQTANISGSIGADGSLDYFVITEVEAGAVGQQVNKLLAGLKGDDASKVNSKIKLNFNVGGTYENPKIVLAGTTSADGTTNTVKEQVKLEVQEEVEEVKKEAEEIIENETQKLMKKGEEQLQQHVDTLKKKISENLKDNAGELLGEELDSTANELKKSLQNLFRKKEK